MFINFAIRDKNNSYYPLHVFIIFYFYPQVIAAFIFKFVASSLPDVGKGSNMFSCGSDMNSSLGLFDYGCGV